MDKDFNNEIIRVTEKINKDSKNLKYILERAHLYESIKDYSKCLNDYKIALEINNNNSEIYFRMGIVYEKVASECKVGFINKEETYDNAYNCYSKAIELNHNNKKFYIYRGNLLKDIFEEDEEALDDYLYAYKLDDRDYELCKLIAGSYYLIDDNKNSIRFYKLAIAMNEDDIYSLQAIADIYQELGEYREAIRYYNKIIGKIDNEYDIYLDRGRCYFKLKDYENALKDLEQCNTSQRDYIYYFLKGKIYEEAQRYKDALSEYDKALTLKDENVIKVKKEAVLKKINGGEKDGEDK